MDLIAEATGAIVILSVSFWLSCVVVVFATTIRKVRSMSSKAIFFVVLIAQKYSGKVEVCGHPKTQTADCADRADQG